MPKADRVQNVQTPGVEAVDLDETATGEADQPTLAPDLQALVAREVAKALGQQKAAMPEPAKPLPTQAEALAMVKADPKCRSVLSVDGWVTVTPPTTAPFAKA